MPLNPALQVSKSDDKRRFHLLHMKNICNRLYLLAFRSNRKKIFFMRFEIFSILSHLPISPPTIASFAILQNAIEPMQVDAQPEDNENNEEEVFIVEECNLDLESYANSYSGLAKLHRLIFIADHCPSLRVEAIKMAINYVMATTYNVTMYQLLHKKLADMTQGGAPQPLPDVASQSSNTQDIPPYDSMWVEQKTKKAALKLEKLDNDLKNSKSTPSKKASGGATTTWAIIT